MVRQILTYPNPILREKAKPVEEVTPEIRELINDMIDTMLEKDGVGLSALQIGESLRIFVVNLSPRKSRDETLVVINPKVFRASERKLVGEEGCLSFPGETFKVTRAEKIQISAKTLTHEAQVWTTVGILARVIQHELDHLDGILVIDREEKESNEIKRTN